MAGFLENWFARGRINGRTYDFLLERAKVALNPGRGIRGGRSELRAVELRLPESHIG